MLTPKMRDVLTAIGLALENSGGVGPSLDELCEAVGLSRKSKATMHGRVTCLEERGYVRRLPRKPRALTLTDAGWAAYRQRHGGNRPRTFTVVR